MSATDELNRPKIDKYRTEHEMHKSLSNACHGKFTMCVPVNISDDDMVLSDVISELIERRKENPKRDELKEGLDQLLQQNKDGYAHSLASFKLTCDSAVMVENIRQMARIGLIREIAWKLGIDLAEDTHE